MDLIFGVMETILPLIIVVTIGLLIAAIYNFARGEAGWGITCIVFIFAFPWVASLVVLALGVILLVIILIIACYMA